MKHANATHADKAPKAMEKPAREAAAPAKEKPMDGEAMNAHSHKGGEHDISKMPIHEAVSKHGPATHMFSEHDHEAGTHHVHTVHGEKHHHSDHMSAGEAHQHMGQAMGEGGDQAEPFEGQETPDEEMAESQSGGGIPGMG
jgi:hypothetical protein